MHKTLLSPARYRDAQCYGAKLGGECGIMIYRVRWTAMVSAAWCSAVCGVTSEAPAAQSNLNYSEYFHMRHASGWQQCWMNGDTPVAGSVGGAEICIDLDVLSPPE